MRILGIETSCDETAIAVIEISGSKTRPRIGILSNIISSQVKLHAKFGGVVPNLAKREHQKNLVPVLLRALGEAGLLKSKISAEGARLPPACRQGRDGRGSAFGEKNQNAKIQAKSQKDPRTYQLENLKIILEREPELFARIREHILPLGPPAIDAIAVTVGPGLAPALWVGVNFARALVFLWKKPLVPINHLEGHIYANLIPEILTAERRKSKDKGVPLSLVLRPLAFPALCLIVSGGHTELVLMSGYGRYRVIGETLDDAAGEAFDKVAKMLGLGFPGGPVIARLAEQWESQIHPAESGTKSKTNPKFQIQNSKQADKLGIKLPRPMIHSRDYNFSFSGLKTAVLYLLRELRPKYSLALIRSLVACEFQNAVADVLISKTVRAARQYRIKTVMIGGGVAANKQLRAQLGEALKKQCPGAEYLTPDYALTGDNALMIALAGYFGRQKKSARGSVRAEANLRLA